MHEVLVNRLGGLSLPRKSVVRLTDRPDMTLDVYRGRKTTILQLYYNYNYITSMKYVTFGDKCMVYCLTDICLYFLNGSVIFDLYY